MGVKTPLDLGALGAIPELGVGEGVVTTKMAGPGLLQGGQMGQIMPGATQAVGIGPEASQALGAAGPMLPDVLRGANAATRAGTSLRKRNQGGGRMPPTPQRRPRGPMPTSLGPIGGELLQAATNSPQRDFLLKMLMQMGQSGNF
jgi:hypothetical protein